MTATGQCTSCTRWGRRGGLVIAPEECCTWLTDQDISGVTEAVATLLRAMPQLLALNMRCPGQLQVDAAAMPDAYRSEDLLCVDSP